jgi:hypothetical protein
VKDLKDLALPEDVRLTFVDGSGDGVELRLERGLPIKHLRDQIHAFLEQVEIHTAILEEAKK